MPLEVVWSPPALARLQEIRAFVALDKPEAAERLAIRIVAVAEALRVHPYLGRATSERGLRELVVGNLPYVILYRVRANKVVILRVRHTAQEF